MATLRAVQKRSAGTRPNVANVIAAAGFASTAPACESPM
jgi:hypothetical protein